MAVRGVLLGAAVAGLGLVLAVVGNLVFAEITRAAGGVAPPVPGVAEWKLAQFLFDYRDLGLAKRALVGTLLDLPNAGGMTGAILALSLGVLGALAVVFGALVARAGDPLMAAIVVASPALFLQAGFDLGRFDQITLLLALAILLPGWAPAVLLAPALVLVHEGAAVMHLPVLLALHWALHRRGRLVAVAGAASAAVLALLALAPPPEREALAALYPRAAPDHLAVLTRGLGDNMAKVAAMAAEFSPAVIAKFAAALGYLGLLFVVLRWRVGQGAVATIAMLAALAPLGLAVLGGDWARWIGLAATNLLMVALVLPAAGRARLPRMGGLLIPAVLAGPIGVIDPFPASILVERAVSGG